MITDEYQRPIHPEVQEYMRRYVKEKQDWETVDDEYCWGMYYTGSTTEIKEKSSHSYTHGEGSTQIKTGRESTTETGERKILSIPRVQRPRNTGRQESGERGHLRHHQESPRNGSSPNFRKNRILGHDQRPHQSSYNTRNSHDPAILRPLEPRRGTMAPTQTHPRLFRFQPTWSQHTTRLKRQLGLDKDRKHRSYAWKVRRAAKEVCQATKYQGDTALTTHPSSKMWGEETKESGEKGSRPHNQW